MASKNLDLQKFEKSENLDEGQKDEEQPEGENTARVPTNPASTHRDDIGTGRQFSGLVDPNLKGTTKQEIIQVAGQPSDPEKPLNQNLEIVLEAESFEEKTKYSTIKLTVGIILLAAVGVLLLWF